MTGNENMQFNTEIDEPIEDDTIVDEYYTFTRYGKSKKQAKARESEMIELWPGMKRCLMCGFAMATGDAKGESIKKVVRVGTEGCKGVVKPVIYSKETGLHSSFHGKFLVAQSKYGKEHFVTYKELQEMERELPNLLEGIESKSIMPSDIKVLRGKVSYYKKLYEKINGWLPSLYSAVEKYPSELEKRIEGIKRAAMTNARDKAQKIRELEIDEYLKYKKEAIQKGEVVEPFEDIPMDERIQNCYSEITLPSENCMEEKYNLLKGRLEQILDCFTSLYQVYGSDEVEDLDKFLITYMQMHTHFLKLYDDLNDLFITRYGLSRDTVHDIIVESSIESAISDVKYESLLGIDFEQLDIPDTFKALQMDENIAALIVKKGYVEQALNTLFTIHYTKSIFLWDMCRPHPRFQDYCVLLWNTPKFLRYIKKYMTELQYIHYKNANIANRQLIDAKIPDVPFYFANVGVSEACLTCHENNEVCKKCLEGINERDKLAVKERRVPKCTEVCNICKDTDCGVKDISYMDDLIGIMDEDEDNTKISTEDAKMLEQMESALTAIGTLTNR